MTIVSADGAIPVHYKLYDGNKTDDKVHIETWKTVREIAGRPDFTYVADSKLCTRENMGFIADQGGVFVTVLARSRQEDDAFRAHLQNNPVGWEEVRREPGDDADSPPRIWEAFAGAGRSSEGYRVIWYRSSIKRGLDESRRTDRIARAKMRIENLEQRTGSHRFRSVESGQKAMPLTSDLAFRVPSGAWFEGASWTGTAGATLVTLPGETSEQ